MRRVQQPQPAEFCRPAITPPPNLIDPTIGRLSAPLTVKPTVTDRVCSVITESKRPPETTVLVDDVQTQIQLRGDQLKKISWDHVMEQWLARGVPDVEVIRFDAQVHFDSLPWIEKKSGRQTLSSSPEKDTARCISNIKVRSDPEAYAAARLLAFCHRGNNDVFCEMRLLAARVMRKTGNPSDYWDGNARWTTPYTNSSSPSRAETTVEGVVGAAATTWAEVARWYQVIRIPCLMDHSSEEHRHWEQALADQREARERAELIRLKSIYDQGSSS